MSLTHVWYRYIAAQVAQPVLINGMQLYQLYPLQVKMCLAFNHFLKWESNWHCDKKIKNMFLFKFHTLIKLIDAYTYCRTHRSRQNTGRHANVNESSNDGISLTTAFTLDTRIKGYLVPVHMCSLLGEGLLNS